MKPEEQILQRLLEAVGQTFGSKPSCPTDFDSLSLAVFRSVKRTISSSTLKRLWGYISDQSGTSVSTLTLLSKYVGYRDWDDFIKRSKATGNLPYDESGFSMGQILACDTLPVGTVVKADWAGGKSCTVRKIASPRRFVVIDSKNIKLKSDDMVTLDSIAILRPFIALECVRGEEHMGNYIGAKQSGIKSFQITEGGN